MRIENTAKMQSFGSDESLTIEKTEKNEYKITAKKEYFGDDEGKENESIEMVYTKKGLNALLGSWMAILE